MAALPTTPAYLLLQYTLLTTDHQSLILVSLPLEYQATNNTHYRNQIMEACWRYATSPWCLSPFTVRWDLPER